MSRGKNRAFKCKGFRPLCSPKVDLFTVCRSVVCMNICGNETRPKAPFHSYSVFDVILIATSDPSIFAFTPMFLIPSSYLVILALEKSNRCVWLLHRCLCQLDYQVNLISPSVREYICSRRSEVPSTYCWRVALMRMGQTQGHADLDLWLAKSNQFILGSTLTFGIGSNPLKVSQRHHKNRTSDNSCCWTTAYDVLCEDSLTCSQEQPNVEPLILEVVDNCSKNWATANNMLHALDQ